MSMARRKKSLEMLLGALDKTPMAKGGIRSALKIDRKTEYRIINEGLSRKWIEEDLLRKYHLTMLGKESIGSGERPLDSTSWEVPSQIIDMVRERTDRPVANCTIQIENANKIKELDAQTTTSHRFLTNDGLGLPENDTHIKSSLAAVVDSILDLKAKDMGLLTILDQKIRDELTTSTLDDQFPSYDYMKRYEQLAKTDLKVLIEFKGQEWVEKQNFEDLERNIADRKKRYKEFSKNAREMASDIQIRKAVSHLAGNTNLTKNTLQANRLFASRQELNTFILNEFKLVNQGQDGQKIIKEAFKSRLFEVKKMPLVHLKVNKEKELQFYKSLRIVRTSHPKADAFMTASKEKDSCGSGTFENIDNIISAISKGLTDFEKAFVVSLQKVTEQFLHKNRSSGPIRLDEEDIAYIKPFLELFYVFEQMVEICIRCCIILWPKKISDRYSLRKLYSVVFDKILDIRMLVYQALGSFHGGDFNKIFDDITINNIDPNEDILTHTVVLEQVGLKNEREQLTQSILKLRALT
jgi:hypothetical protein